MKDFAPRVTRGIVRRTVQLDTDLNDTVKYVAQAAGMTANAFIVDAICYALAGLDPKWLQETLPKDSERFYELLQKITGNKKEVSENGTVKH